MAHAAIRFGLIALVPAAFGPLPAARAAILMPLCSGMAAASRPIPIELPLPDQDRACCAKGCHTGGCRKKAERKIEPAQ